MRCCATVLGGSVAFLAFASIAQAKLGDPCDFVSSGATSFSHEQVLHCYRSVPFEPADLINIIDVIEQHRSFSDLAEIYEARVHWREALAALEHDYPNDMVMHDAIKREHHDFGNVHVSYFPPQCYSALLIGFTPLEFGSTVRNGGAGDEQLIFVESAPLAATYREATAIDASSLVGQRVVSINGVPVLDYFRAYAQSLNIHEDAGGGLNGILSSDTYSIRINGGGDYFPERSADEYVFETIDGERSTVTLPWVFIPKSTLLPNSALPLTQNSEQFIRLCQVGPEVTPPAVAANAGAPSGLSRGAQPFGIDAERDELVRRLRASATQGLTRAPSAPPSAGLTALPSTEDPVAPTSYHEVPPERLGLGIEVVVPSTNNATVLQYDGHVTALQLLDTVAWVDVARRGVDYACEHSDRLIVDLRGNNGGNDTVIRWLHHYLFPERGQLIAAGLLPFRMRNDSPAFNELLESSARFMEEYAPALGLDPCELSFTPGCLTDVETGEPLVADANWFASPTVVEERAHVPVSLSRQVAVWNVNDPEFDSASCAGRFQGDNLVFITDGRNASGGYFLPASFEGEGVIVNTGGFVGEPMAMGRALSGGSIPGTTWAALAASIEEATVGEIQFDSDFIPLVRPVNTRMEMLGIYRKDGRTLHIEAPVRADLHVNVWTDLPGSNGFVYERVLEAVDEAAAHRRQ
jgi:hypothetical protein